MNFSEALKYIKKGDKLRRQGWGNETFVFLVPGSEFEVNRFPLNTMFSEGTKIRYAPHIDVCIGTNVSVWDAQTMDILAEDWGFYAKP